MISVPLCSAISCSVDSWSEQALSTTVETDLHNLLMGPATAQEELAAQEEDATLAELHVLVLTSFIKLIKLLQNLMNVEVLL